MNNHNKLLRSWIFVPGSRQRMIDKALGLAADAIMFDIEDGVAPSEKETARRQIASVLDKCEAQTRARSSVATPARYVRVNAVGSDRIDDDLAAAVRPGCEGLVLPKLDRAEEITALEAAVATLEKERGMVVGALPLLPSIESPIGLFSAFAIATSSPRVIGLILGTEDYCRAMGLPLRREGEARDLIYALIDGDGSRRGPCSGRRRNLAAFGGWRGSEALCPPGTRARHVRYVAASPKPNRRGEQCFQSQSRRFGICRGGPESV
jgi:hypothetical protein